MQAEENYNDDLEYLAKQGFENVKVSDDDLNDLKKRIRRRSFSFGSVYLAVGSLFVGGAIGAALFFSVTERSDRNYSLKSAEQKTEQTASASGGNEKIIILDTISIEKENFINPSKISKQKSDKAVASNEAADSADVILSKPVDLSLLNNGIIKEEKLKYMANAPVFYLHDMKITSYTTLYFKKNHFVKFTGLSAAYSGTAESAPAGSGLKQSPDYYLHDEIANAMLQFKNGKYDLAIQSLKTIAFYNENDLNCDFYLAMCYYHKKNFNKAAELFDRCLTNTNNTFLQEAEYYKALSQHESGKAEDAKLLFRKIYEEEGFYSKKAKAYLNN